MKQLLNKSDISHVERSREDVSPALIEELSESGPDLSFQTERENSPIAGMEPEISMSGSFNIPCGQNNHPSVLREVHSEEEVRSGNKSPTMEEDLQMPCSSHAQVMQSHEVRDVGSESGDESLLPMTQSFVKDATVRRRYTKKWICMFDIMGALEMQGREQGTIENMETTEIEKIDNYLKGFFWEYNKNIKEMTDKNYKAIAVLGGRYTYHAENKLVKGVLVVIGNAMVENLALNSHLLFEKCSPSSDLLYKKFHNIHIGHAYPIHIEDIVCIGGNSLRQLLKNWVDEDFYESLHWIVPPTTPKMRMERPKDANAKEREDLGNNVALIKKMKKSVLRNRRKTIDSSPYRTKIPNHSSKKTQTQYNSLYEHFTVMPGKEYPVRSHHWEVIEIPFNEDDTVNDRAHRMADAIKQNGGVVRREC